MRNEFMSLPTQPLTEEFWTVDAFWETKNQFPDVWVWGVDESHGWKWISFLMCEYEGLIRIPRMAHQEHHNSDLIGY